MGHIKAHLEISSHVMDQLKSRVPGANLPNLLYIELGNFITDIAQFRDPYAYMKAKSRVWNTALDESFFSALFIPLGAGNVRPWMNDLLGRKGYRHGALADFFEKLALAFTHMFFANDSPMASSFFIALANFSNITLLPADEVDRVFNYAFTQYYPHEHVDFPPEGEGRKHRENSLFQPGSRKFVISYLEEQLQYVSEELSKLELEWVLKQNLPATDPQRCDLLVKLGHLLHAVEDFYFHSNVVEVRQWRTLLKLYPQRQPEQKDEDYQFLASKILQGTRHEIQQDENKKTELARRLTRRLRYPIFVRGTKGDPNNSENSTKLIYTGGFGENDMFHTLTGALEALEEILAGLALAGNATAQGILNSDLVLLKTFFHEQERRDLVEDEDETYKKFRMQEHYAQLIGDMYLQWVSDMRTQGKITARVEAALSSAFQEDRILEDKYPGMLGKNVPGVGGFLIETLTVAQAEVDKSHQKAKELNSHPESIYGRATVNGASEETVGTHTLMAKDSAEKEPLREEAIALAKFASAAIAVLLVRRVQNESDPDKGLDWDTLLRHFVRFPPDRSNCWEEEVLAALSAGNSLPTLDTIQDKPNYGMLTKNDPGRKLEARREGDKHTKKSKLQELQDRYEWHERKVDE